MAGLDLDFLTRAINIHWGGGLAVEFEDEPTEGGEPATDTGEYPELLNLENGIADFSKAVISFWFRVPRASMEATTFTDILPRIIPLVTFGKPQTRTNYQAVYKDIVADWNSELYPKIPVMAIADYVEETSNPSTPIDPCHIGLECFGTEARLVFNIQLGQRATIGSAGWVPTSVNVYDKPFGTEIPHGAAPIEGNSEVYGVYAIKDVSYIETAAPEAFRVYPTILITPDEWHHLLLSFDLSGSCAVGQPHPSSSCRLWYAIDDINYNGPENLQPDRSSDDGLGLNTVVASNIASVSGGTPGTRMFLGHSVPATYGTYNPEPIPTADEDFGIPASTGYEDNIYRVEMAEFQMWTGVILDTDITANRRAFVDQDGFPVEPKGTEEDPTWPAERLLGKKPEILLHGSSKWTLGYNTGTTGVTRETASDGTETLTKIPLGQFQPVGNIERFKPDPSLEDTA